MILCPLTVIECQKSAMPHPKAIFIMSPAHKKMSSELRRVTMAITNTLKRHQCKYIEGAKLEGVGDFSCAICSDIQGCPLGVAIVGRDTPLVTAGNIWWEAGLMQGFGKPIIAVVYDAANLPSDFVRTFSVFYATRGYTRKLFNMVQRLMTRTDFFMKIGDRALKAGNYEKAGLLYREEYLNTNNPMAMEKIANTIDLLKRSNLRAGYKQDLLDSLSSFHEKCH
jgi:hypothetical protein